MGTLRASLVVLGGISLEAHASHGLQVLHECSLHRYAACARNRVGHVECAMASFRVFNTLKFRSPSAGHACKDR